MQLLQYEPHSFFEIPKKKKQIFHRKSKKIVKHTSEALTINENYDPAVRSDMEKALNKIAPENAPYYTHVPSF